MSLSRLKKRLAKEVAASEHPPEMAIDVMYALQAHFGYLNDEAVALAAELVGMSPLQIDELATFYTFIYRAPVGRYVIHVCDSVICWMDGAESVRDYIGQKLSVEPGGTTGDGLFSLLPVCCIGYCDRAPAMLVNLKVYGHLTTEKIDRILEGLRAEAKPAGKKA